MCKKAVGVMLTWSAGKSTLATAEETGEGLKMVRAVKTSVLRHRSTDASNTSSLRLIFFFNFHAYCLDFWPFYGQRLTPLRP